MTTQQGDDSFEVDRAVQDALERLTLVANASEALSSTLELEPGLRRLARVLVPALGDWCAIDLLEDDGRLRRVVLEHREPDALPAGFLEALLPASGPASQAPLARALRGAGPLRLTDFPSPGQAADALHRIELRTFQQLGAHSAILIPLRARRRVLGVLTLVRTGPEEENDRLQLIEDLSHRIAITVDNAHLHAQIAHTAEHLQRSLLPDLPHDGPVEIAARYAPARASAEVGGDWYDAFPLPDGALTLIIGDVTGHDLKAAVAMSQMRNMLRGIACDRKEPPGKILARLDAANEILYPGQTLTCLYSLLTKPETDGHWLLEYAAAGHVAPLLVTREGDTRFLTGGRSLLLGVSSDTLRPDATEVLPPESTVLLYTDGLIERRTENLDDSMTRLRQHAAALARTPLESFCDELMVGLGEASTDDIALIAVRIPAALSTPYTATPE
ncbi:Serine phosphatase RsbU, regulator of sigma subunit [Streptomyces sp. DvalAA-14]|uniref:PP2C family protein-serine/threonine phosphatase n=1 Tax=unclassified Streptomyces TaxID=2593676 RepID=UPI00081B5984|nr:GAF domain-containing SpoIIE family protein phosphatase [Streptomyces sp. DvalAA-14]SCD84175.1 Serine phosphatase RsbU, regulator of sigma subunit [Streptomyces sp. DvalAA-14]